MRRLPPSWKRFFAAAAAWTLAASPAGAGQADGLDLSLAPPALPSAETGKPATAFPAVPAAPEGGGCLPALPCGSRLYGAVRKNGAVELQVPAMRW